MSSLGKKDIIDFLSERKDELDAYGVAKIGLFGSFLKGTQQPDSDIDFLVDFEPGKKNYDNYIELSFFLEDNLHRKVDLLTPESLSPYIGPRILSEVEYLAFR